VYVRYPVTSTVTPHFAWRCGHSLRSPLVSHLARSALQAGDLAVGQHIYGTVTGTDDSPLMIYQAKNQLPGFSTENMKVLQTSPVACHGTDSCFSMCICVYCSKQPRQEFPPKWVVKSAVRKSRLRLSSFCTMHRYASVRQQTVLSTPWQAHEGFYCLLCVLCVVGLTCSLPSHELIHVIQVFVYVCMYVCVCVCMYVCVYVCMYVCRSIHKSTNTQIHIMYIYIYIYILSNFRIHMERFKVISKQTYKLQGR
jgi:hypothetical protein